jgi:DNA-binding transcriptional MerR regulator
LPGNSRVATAEKAPGALKTIGELSHELGVAQHILRYWETKFPQLKPMQRAGNRRYYRPADVELAQRINRLLNEEGYTVRGVQKLLRERGDQGTQPIAAMPAAAPPVYAMPEASEGDDPAGVDVFRLIQLRNRLVEALED